MQDLTTKQQRFVEEYVIDFNATRAAISAGYSEKTARSISSELLTKPDIRSAIKTHLDELSTDSYVSREVILTGLLKEAMGRGESSSANSRVSAWDKLAKLSGLYADTKPQLSIDDIIRDITENNAAKRKSLLPKDNIRPE
ncbi:MAG: terminase small subunit, partial [Colwellia sp.]|nr:terminase small subunit [Colwellia sp.]